MATTFDVIPSLNTEVTFGDVLELAQGNINRFLAKLSTPQSIKLRAEIITGEHRVDANPTATFEWPQDKTYAWFSIEGIAGGTDAYCDTISSSYGVKGRQWWFLDELREAPGFQAQHETILSKAKALDRMWSFRRSMGQPPIINLSYGFIAGALAELTGGLVFSGDGAWDYQRLPISGPQFLAEYFSSGSSIKPEIGN
jgi:hypothetical protein